MTIKNHINLTASVLLSLGMLTNAYANDTDIVTPSIIIPEEQQRSETDVSAQITDQSSVTIAEEQQRAVILKELLNRVENQLNTIDLSLEALALAINNNSIKLEDKKPFRAYIEKMRSFIDKIRKSELLDFNESNLEMLLEVNKTLLTHINTSINTGLKKLTIFDEQEILDQVKRKQYPATDPKNLVLMLNEYDDQVKTLNKKFSVVGSSPLNIVVKAAEKSAKSWHLTTIAKRALPYAGLGIYWLALQDDKHITHLNIGFLSKLKKLVGTLAKDEERIAPVEKSEKSDHKIPVDSGETRKFKHVAHTDGLLGTPSFWFKHFVKIDEHKPIINIGIAALLAPTVKKDFTDLTKWGLTQGKKAYAFIKGDSFEDDSPIKKSKVTFDDIVGYDHAKKELAKIVNYFKTKDMYDLTGTQIDFSYLFVGPSDITKSLAQAVAGEVTKDLKAQKKKNICGIYEIHASKLIDKELKSIVEEAEKETPCIVIINELDWLSTQKTIKPKVWGDVINTINKTLKNHKKQVCIIATAQNSDILSSIAPSSFGVILNISKPTLIERQDFFKKELLNRCINISKFNLEILAQQTENCSYNQLSSIIKRSLALSRSQNETLNHQHLEQSINEIVHNIITKSESTDSVAKQILAANYAGKALAHILLQPQAKLIKVTTLPIVTKKGIEHGGLITYNADLNSDYVTDKDIEKECLIQLAGIHAQKLLLGKVSAKISQEIKEHVSSKIDHIVFEGLDKNNLPAKLKEAKLQQSYDIFEKFNQTSSEFIREHQDELKNIFNNLESKAILTNQEITTILDIK